MWQRTKYLISHLQNLHWNEHTNQILKSRAPKSHKEYMYRDFPSNSSLPSISSYMITIRRPSNSQPPMPIMRSPSSLAKGHLWVQNILNCRRIKKTENSLKIYSSEYLCSWESLLKLLDSTISLQQLDWNTFNLLKWDLIIYLDLWCSGVWEYFSSISQLPKYHLLFFLPSLQNAYLLT